MATNKKKRTPKTVKIEKTASELNAEEYIRRLKAANPDKVMAARIDEYLRQRQDKRRTA